jgi:hypothetical protein
MIAWLAGLIFILIGLGLMGTPRWALLGCGVLLILLAVLRAVCFVPAFGD